jgi:quinohemoprotein amine dehydrogenase
MSVPALIRATGVLLVLAHPSFAQGQAEPGIPVTDPLVLAKCGACHAVDALGTMQRVSWARATPEGWQDVIRRTIRENGVSLTPPEAREIIRYLSTRHGLAPEETQPVMYYAERRIRDEAAVVSAEVREGCSRCHQAGRALTWRRSAADWKVFAERHAATYRFDLEPEAVASLIDTAPLRTREWDAWSARARTPDLTGRWLANVRVHGRGSFSGEVFIEPLPGSDEFLMRVDLRALDGASVLARTGRGVVYAGHTWRGRSSGTATARPAPDDLSNETRDVLWVASDGSTAEGRWFWGQYQELGFDVKLRRPSSNPTLLLVDPVAFKLGSAANRMRLIGDRFPEGVTAADVVVGPGMTVNRIVSSGPSEIVAEVDVSGEAVPGRRDIGFRSSTLEHAVALYDRVDYIMVVPDSSTATFGDQLYPRGFQQFAAIGYQRGPDGSRQTSDDVDLGPIEATWSMEIHYEIDQSQQDRVGSLGPTGFFAPAVTNPGANYDVWIIATAKRETSPEGRPLVGKGYLVLTVPTYSLGGRTFVRDLDRWIEESAR